MQKAARRTAEDVGAARFPGAPVGLLIESADEEIGDAVPIHVRHGRYGATEAATCLHVGRPQLVEERPIGPAEDVGSPPTLQIGMP